MMLRVEMPQHLEYNRLWHAGVHASDTAYQFGLGVLAHADADFGVNPMQRKLKLSTSGDAKHPMCREEDQAEKQR